MDKIKISTQQNAASIKSWVFETSMSNSTVTESLGGKAGAQDFSLSGKPGNCFWQARFRSDPSGTII